MSIDEGPFQNIAGVSFPDEVWALDIGTMFVTGYGTWNLVECASGAIAFDAYREYSDNRLTCCIRDCTETSFRIRGRSSGVEADVDLQLKVAAGADCNAGCVVDIGAGQYIGGARGFYISGQWVQTAFVHSPELLGFTDGERMDLLVRKPWDNPILSVQSDSVYPSNPMLDLADPHGCLRIGMRVRVENSALYAGDWSVLRLPGASQVTLSGGITFLGDDTGNLRPHFDYT